MKNSTQIAKSRTVLIAIAVISAYTIWGVCGSLLPPFFPQVAISKGADITQSGFVFGIFSLAGFISSPLFGKYGSRISPGFLYIPSAFIIAGCTLTFGWLLYIDNLNLFLTLAYILRVLAGMANAAAWGSLLAALVTLFPNHLSKIAAASELFYATGYMLGPVLGALLYNTGGFMLPFQISGLIGIIATVLLVASIPKVNVLPEDEQTGTNFGLVRLIGMPSVSLPLIDSFTCNFGLGMNESMIGLYLESIGANTNIISAAFFLYGGSYMLSTVISGYVSDKLAYPTVLSILGNASLIFAFTMIGPLPFIPIRGSISLVLISIAIAGCGIALVYVSSFTRSQLAATRNGFPEGSKTYHLISSMWVSMDFMGNFFGASVGGLVVQKWGFRTATVISWIGYLIMMVMDVLELRYQKSGKTLLNKIKYSGLKNED